MRSLTLISIFVLFTILINDGFSKPINNSIEKGKELGKKLADKLTTEVKANEEIDSIKLKIKSDKTVNPKSEEIKKDDNKDENDDENDENSDDETETEIVTEVVTEFVEEEGTTIVYEDEDETTTETPTTE